MDYVVRQDRAVENYVAEKKWRAQNMTLAPNPFPPQNGLWLKIPQYPESFQMKPQRGDIVPSSLYKEMPFDLVSPCELELIRDHWKTTTGQAHNEKILPRRFQKEVLAQAPSAMKMNYMFPHCDDRIKMTSKRMLYNAKPFGHSMMKTDYKAVYPIAELDYRNGPLAQVTHPRCVRFVRRTELKPGFPVDENNSVYRKFNPYMTVTRMDYRNLTGDLMKTGVFGCC